MTFDVKGRYFFLDDKKVFLNSGEIHYFRIKRELWDKHLEAARDAGLAVVSTYVPWAWHEEQEGHFDFDGSTSPERDLRGWLQRCKAHGLYCILKPGPFILAETRGAGLPDWFLDKYGDAAKMKNSRGDIVRSDGVSLFNDAYIEKVTLWYDQIMPLIREHEISEGGPVIMMQVCNEIGVFSWLAKQGDYGNKVREKFIAFLSDKYDGIEEINTLWGTDYPGFSDIELPPDGNLPYASGGDRGRDHEWHLFWRAYYGDYLRMLYGMARDRGVTVPMYHNLPGWIFGHGYEFPVNITMYDDLFGDGSGIIFGVDHIPEFLSYRNMHDDRIINDITGAVQGIAPLFAAEFQCGSREYHVVTNPREMELFYKASIANGLTGWNYYMFSQGRNPRRRGYSGQTFYWFNPMTPEGVRTSAFPLVRKMSSIVRTAEEIILNASRKAEICVLFYPPYYATELERPADGSCGLQFVPSAIRRPAYFDGLLKVLQLLNIDYDMADLSRSSAQQLGRYRQVWAFCTDEMNAADQQTIVDYASAGGNIVIFPYLPDREMSQRKCTLIRDALGVTPSGTEIIDSPLIDILGMTDIKCSNPQVIYSGNQLRGSEIIARTIKGSVCGFSMTLGSGTVLHLGTWLGFDTEGHKSVYEAILRSSGARLRHAEAAEENIIVKERFTDTNKGLLFAGNYYNEEQGGKVTYTHPETGESVSFPAYIEEMLWPPLCGVLTPVCMEVADGLKILHCTSDLLGISATKNQVSLTLYGDRDLPGEVVFEGAVAERVEYASVAGRSVEMVRDAGRIAFIYSHMHGKEFTVDIKIR